jgi:hypothetical protein
VEPRVQETTHNDGEVSIDISGNPITNDYATIDTIQRRHQAGDYSGWTGMGDGILKARELLVGRANDPDDIGYSRFGARPTMLIMTDGQTNQGPSGWSLPGNFSWSDWADYDGDCGGRLHHLGLEKTVFLLGSNPGYRAWHQAAHNILLARSASKWVGA